MHRSRIIAVLAAVLTMVLTMVLGMALAPASALAAYSGPYQIKFEHSGKCLDLYQNRAFDGAIVQQWTCASPSSTNKNHQQWVFEWNSDVSGAEIRKWNTNYCINGGGENGRLLYLWTCGVTPIWVGYKMHGGPPDWYKMTQYGGQFCMDVPRSSTADGTRIQVWACQDASGNQHMTWYPF
jgi:hypothetical protein